MHSFPFHIGDWKKKLGHLSAQKQGYALNLRLWYLAHEAPLPNEEVAEIAGGPRLTVETVMRAAGFVYKSEGNLWINAELDGVIEDYRALQRINSEKGKKGGRPRKAGGFSAAYPGETHGKANQEPVTNNQEEAQAARAVEAEKPEAEAPADSVHPDGFHRAAEPGELQAMLERAKPAAEAAVALRKLGVRDATPTRPELVQALLDGILLSELTDTATEHPGKPLAYVINTIRRRRADAAAQAGAVGAPVQVGPRFNPDGVSPRRESETAEQRAIAAANHWHSLGAYDAKKLSDELDAIDRRFHPERYPEERP